MTADLAPVGVLALQGDFAAHREALARAGVAAREVRTAADLRGISGLVLPGGESTAMLRLVEAEGLELALGDALRSGMPTLATCAGLILCAAEVEGPSQRSFGVLDVTVRRNGYGRQYHSGTFALDSDVLPPGTTGAFIRAPRILRVGPTVAVLARRGADPVLVRRGRLLGACFHPELDVDHPVTTMFVDALRSRSTVPDVTR